jgi:two-component system, chemotaxis family, protein-glutamate methylesterase/glutaminase
MRFQRRAEEIGTMLKVPTEAVKRDIVVVGASAGGVESLRTLVAELPGNLPAAVVVVLHVAATGRSVLPSILSRAGEMAASHPEDGEPIEHGKIYVAPPDRHIVVHENTLGVQAGPKEDGHRPAIDPLFRSAASHYGPRVVGVVLSGTLDDGASGLRSIKEAGGLALVQDPDEAMYESMPRAAIANSHPDAVVPAAVIGRMIGEVAGTPVEQEEEAMADVNDEGESGRDMMDEDPQHGRRAAFACPDCGGGLWEVEDGGLLRFRCRVGHAFSEASMLERQSDALETALWTGLRVLEERAALAHRLSKRLATRGSAATGRRFERQAAEAEAHAGNLRELLESIGVTAAPDPAAEQAEQVEKARRAG